MRQLVGSGGRLLGVDVARFVALAGMMSVHIFPAQQPDGSLHPSYAVAAGRSAALFAVLAGVGIALVTGGPEPPRGTRRAAFSAGLVARSVLLVAIGLLLGRVDSPPLVILAYYGVLFVLALPALGLGSRGLAVLAVVCVVVTPVLSQLWRLHVSATPIAEPGGRDLLKELFLTGTYPALTWTTYLFAGMAVGRCPLRRERTAANLVIGGAAAAIAAKLLSSLLVSAAGGVDALSDPLPADSLYRADTSRWLGEGLFGTTPTESWRWLFVSAPHSGTTFDLVHTTGTSLAVLGACLLLVRWLPRTVVLPFAAAGSMTLTLYTVHVLALADGSPLVIDDRLALWFAHVSLALLVATVWRGAVGRGPLEALTRSVERASRRWIEGGRSRQSRQPTVSPS